MSEHQPTIVKAKKTKIAQRGQHVEPGDNRCWCCRSSAIKPFLVESDISPAVPNRSLTSALDLSATALQIAHWIAWSAPAGDPDAGTLSDERGD